MKEREGKKGKTNVEQESSGQEEHGEEGLQFTDDLAREPVSQEGEGNSLLSSGNHLVLPIFILIHFIGFFLLFFLNVWFPFCTTDNGLSVPSDASLSPASQNSPYSITPVSQGSPASSGIGSPMASNAITKIHSRRFRE